MMASDRSLGQDEIFEVLSSPRRRYAISVLNRHDGPMELTELAEEVAAIEHDTTVEDLGEQQRKRVYVSLYQTHVPKLAETGIVLHDTDAGTVELAPAASEIDTYLSEDEQGQDWWQYYLVFTGLAGVLLVGVVVDVGPFGAVPDVVVASIAVVGIMLLAVAQYVVEGGDNR